MLAARTRDVAGASAHRKDAGRRWSRLEGLVAQRGWPDHLPVSPYSAARPERGLAFVGGVAGAATGDLEAGVV
ncbi:MAG: hypothetical protein QOF86_4044 [Baekduia sp.]|nr:hypothetical protein [Baekduia sp.]